jgi:hypothetical protein
LCLVFLVAACGGGGGGESPALTEDRSIVDTGDVRVTINKSESYPGLENVYAGGYVEYREGTLNEWLKYPKGDVFVEFKDCYTINAFYTPSTSTISMCYELLIDIYNFFITPSTSDEMATLAAFGAFEFIFAHEFAHMMIDKMDLPALGSEESIADSIAAVYLLGVGSSESVLSSAFYFLNMGSTYWTDNHRANPQRFGDLVCLAIGGDPSVTSNPIFKELEIWLTLSGRNCANEFKVQKETIYELIEPYLMDPAKPLPRNRKDL